MHHPNHDHTTATGICLNAPDENWSGTDCAVQMATALQPDPAVPGELADGAALDSLALQGAGIATWAWDLRTGAVTYGLSWRRVFGAHMPAGIGTLSLWHQVVHPEDLASLTAALDAALAPDGPGLSLMHRLRREDDSYTWVLAQGAVVARDAAGAPEVMAGTLFPVDSWQAREAALIAAEARSRAIFNECFQFVGLLDTEGTLLEANRTALEFAGIAAADVIGRLFWETPWWTHSEAAAESLRNAVAQAAEGAFVRFETSHTAADGRLIFVDFSLKPLFNAEGKVAYLLPEGRDISARRQVEEALRKSEARFRSYFELNLIGMATTSPVKGWLQVNDRLCEILGYNREELAALTWAALTHPDDLQTDEALFDRVLAGEIDGYNLDKRFIRKDGTTLHASISVKCLRKPDGAVDYFVSLLQDITDRKRVEEERLMLERKLLHAQKLESLGVMAGGIAHDFNNLLTAITGNLELATLYLDPTSPSRLWIERADHAAQRAADLTRQMLAYSGKGRFLVQHLNLNELVDQNAALFRATVAKNVNVEMDLTQSLPSIYVDPGQMQQVLMNLITNAAEAIGDKDGRLRLATGVVHMDARALEASLVDVKPVPGTFVYLDVIDDGCGMDATTRERLFDPFFTTKFTGRGLGMSAVLGILRGHAGAMLLQTRPGEGTAIRVLFPVAATTDVAGAAPPSVEPGDGEPLPLDRTILLVDDEEIVRQLGLHMLEHMGARVLVAEDGEEAIRVYTAHRDAIDVVLMDLSMPRMNGMVAAAGIKAIEPDARIVLASGYSEEDALTRFALEKPDHFVQKPYSYQRLRAAILSALGA